MDAADPNDAPHRPPRRRRLLAAAALLAVATFVILWGNDRQPADPTAILTLAGTPEHETFRRPTLRLATFNIHGMKGPDGVRDPERTAASLRDLDFVALQEVRAGWGFPTDQATWLGERLEMASLFAPFERRWWTDSFGTGLLTRVAMTSFHRIPLPGDDPERFRNAILARLRLQGQMVNILAVHLDNHRDHDRQLAAVIDLFLSLEAPAVLLGDMNTAADDPQLLRLIAQPGVADCVGEQWHDSGPRRGVDWIVLRGLRCVRHECRDLGASDHPVVCAEVELLPTRDRPQSTAAAAGEPRR